MQTKLEQASETLVNVALDEVLTELAKRFCIKSGDITPQNFLMLDYYKKQISKLCAEVIKENI